MSVQVISFNCLLKNKAGRTISSTYNRDVLNGPSGVDLGLTGLAKGLQNLQTGERRTVALSAEQAYGLYDPQKVILFPKGKLSDEPKVGMIVSIKGKSGQTRVYSVLQVMDAFVSLDGNHPLAGQDLVFEIETLSAREATVEEIDESLGVTIKLN